MELDVHVVRDGGQPWGFRLVGGVDYGSPLTVVKVVSNSPAEKANLQNGDAITSINGASTKNMSHDAAKDALGKVGDHLEMTVARGLYDPVLDDYEPIYEPIDPLDFDQPSHPSEVQFEIQKFVELPNGTQYNQTDQLTPISDFTLGQLETRSLTASPFLVPIKPYRPFSTEPIEVPPLEDPIILNPNYRDDFSKYDSQEPLPETKFKLPISEQYDPDGTKRKRLTTQTETTKEMQKEEEENMMRKEIKYMEQMRKDIDLDKIEWTATSIVDESIQKAVTLAEEIKGEIQFEISESMTREFESKTEILTTETTESNVKRESSKNIDEQVDLIHKTTADIVKVDGSKSEVCIANDVKKNEFISKEEKHIERKSSLKQEIDEKIEASSCKIKSIVFDTETESKVVSNKQDVQSANSFKKDMTTINCVDVSKTKELTKDEKYTNLESSQKGQNKSTARLLAEQRAYTIGLQTIPHIKGSVHSSYHYNLLLKTFFIHLTDVMVALSRFILTEPIFSQSEEKESSKNEQFTEKTFSEQIIDVNKQDKRTSEMMREENLDKIHTQKLNIKEDNRTEQQFEKKVVDAKETFDNAEVTQEHLTIKNEQRVRKLSGAKMAQLTEKKSEELIQKMGAVVSEFQTKAGIEEKEVKRDLNILLDNRSRSCSIVKENILNSNETIEMTSQLEKTQIPQEMIDSKSTTITEPLKIKTGQSIHEARESQSHSKEGSNTYIAIVEAHVYTNKDAIFEEHLSSVSDITSSKMVVGQETQEAFEAIEAISTEKIAVESSKVREASTAAIQSTTAKNEVEIVQFAQAVEENINEIQEIELKESIEVVESQEQSKIGKNEIDIVEQVMQEVKQLEFEQIVEEDVKEIQEIESKESIEVIESQEQSKIGKNEIDIVEQVMQEVEQLEFEQIVEEDVKEIQEIESKESLEVIESQEQSKIGKNEVDIVKQIMQEVKQLEFEQIVEEDVKEIQEIELKKSIEVTESQEQSTIVEQVMQEVKQLEFEQLAEENFKEIQEIELKESIEVIEPAIEVQEIEAAETYKELSTEIEEQKVELEVEKSIKVTRPVQDEYVELKIVKEEVIELEPVVEVIEEEINVYRKIDQSLIIDAETQETTIEKRLESQVVQGSLGSHSGESITESEIYQKNKIERNYESQEIIQESTLIARSVETTEIEDKKLSLQTAIQEIQNDEDTNIDTPTPSTVPPTPLTDEYVFKLAIPLPKSRGTTPAPIEPIPEPKDEKPSDEDPHIVKKKLVPVIDSPVIESIIFDPPLPTPEEQKVEPKYVKPGLRGGADNAVYRKEEIQEIERKSSLLASAIDETIKSIEEYKEEVGIETKKEDKVKEVQSAVSTKVERMHTLKETTMTTKTSDIEAQNKMEEEWNIIKKQVETNNKNISKLSNLAFQTNEQLETNRTEQAIVNNGHNMNNDGIKHALKENKVNDTETRNTEIEIKQESDFNTDKNFNISDIMPKNDNKTVNMVLDNVDNKVDEVKIEIQTTDFTKKLEKKKDEYSFKPVEFNPDDIPPSRPRSCELYPPVEIRESSQEPILYVTETGEVLGTTHGIVDGLEKAVVDEEELEELGKPGMSEEKIAELISGEAEMLREAHVMGLSRVLSSHMHRAPDDSSVDFQKIKPLVESLKDSEVLKALNEDLAQKKKEEKKREEKKWTKFLQKPSRPVPKAKFGYQGYIAEHEEIQNPYRVKIVKQAKPKVAPDYKPENFETGPLPWEARALNEPPPPPVEPEEPILIPEEVPEFLEAVDPLPESEVPDLEETGIQLPPEKTEEEETPTIEEITTSAQITEEAEQEDTKGLDSEAVVEETENLVKEKVSGEMEENKLAEQLIKNVESMVDPNAPLEQQLAQMRAQLAALAQLPGVIQQTLEIVTKHLEQLGTMETTNSNPSQRQVESFEQTEVTQNHIETIQEETAQELNETLTKEEINVEENRESQTREELVKVEKEQEEILEEQRRIEKQKKELIEQIQQEQESRQLKQRPTPRVGKPKPVFGPLTPQARPVILPGGRRWRKPKDAYNEQLIAEVLNSQAEIIQGKAKGSYESVLLPYDERINFMKYEKPPVSLDHLKHSDVYKLIHDMEQSPMKRVEMLTPVMAEADYREKCRSVTPNVERMANQQQLQP